METPSCETPSRTTGHPSETAPVGYCQQPVRAQCPDYPDYKKKIESNSAVSDVFPPLSAQECHLVQHLGNFQDGKWLSDENINWYMDGMRIRDDWFRRKDSCGHKRCYYFNSFFYTQMFGLDSDKLLDYTIQMKKWGRNGLQCKYYANSCQVSCLVLTIYFCLQSETRAARAD